MKTSILSAIIGLGLLSQADAINVTYVTGSTAFRSTVYNVLNTPGYVFDAGTTILRATRKGSSPSGASYMLFLGVINGTTNYINCAWSGSEAGIASVAGVDILNEGLPLPGSPETWLKADGTVPFTDDTGVPAAGELEASSRQGDLAFADTSQAVSLTPPSQVSLKSFGALGAVTFAWVKNYNTSPNAAWNNFTNITIPQINVLISQGSLPASYFTGNPADTNMVYLVGRNKGSGTRANALADHGYGTTKSVNQFSIGGGVTNSQSDTLDLAYVGNNGYESGGSGVARALSVDGSCGASDPFTGTTGWIAIGYLGTSDALARNLTTNEWLTLDGVPANNGTITSGQYTFWGNEHLYGRNGISGYQDTVGSAIASGVLAKLSDDAAGSVPSGHSGGVSYDYMQVEKIQDTSYPTLK